MQVGVVEEPRYFADCRGEKGQARESRLGAQRRQSQTEYGSALAERKKLEDWSGRKWVAL